MRGSATLADLDHYLRAIWLECCGHLSRFSVGGWDGAEISKRRRVEQVFRLGLELVHIYDFGTSSETLIKVVDGRKGKPHGLRRSRAVVQPSELPYCFFTPDAARGRSSLAKSPHTDGP